MAFKAFDRVVSLAPDTADTKWVEAELARLAVISLHEAQREGVASALYVRAVNGRRNVPENQVRVPGAIVYSFQWLEEAARYAIEWLRVAAPVRSGRYRRSFIVVADGRETAIGAMGFARVVQIVNTQPYSRKIQVGSRGFEIYRGLFDGAQKRVAAQFRGLVKVRATFVRLSDGYRLRRRGRRRGRPAGAEITYPALELTSETVDVN